MNMAYTLAELAKRSETPPRTIRFYIARGILASPSQAGRNAVYGDEHLARLLAISKWKREGRTLADIALELSPGASRKEMPMPSLCHSYTLSDDVSVLVRADVPPWRMNRIRKTLAALTAQLRKETEDEKGRY
jgi:DNA-binding transcriptional MerR regulator